jgi:hypothetical protein
VHRGRQAAREKYALADQMLRTADTLPASTFLTQLPVSCYQYFWYVADRRATLSEETVSGLILTFDDGRIENV